MKHDRLHALTDGIFAIVMTLLVLELKVPEAEYRTSAGLWHLITDQYVVLISYFISFAVLFVYWRAHNFILTVMAKNLDINLININGIFLLLVGLVPFSTHVLGAYGDTALGIIVYAMNIILIGGTLMFMRLYIERSTTIDNLERTAEQRRGAYIRVMTPIICAVIAIVVSFWSTQAAFIILLFAVAYNFHNNAADLTHKLFIVPLQKVRLIKP